MGERTEAAIELFRRRPTLIAELMRDALHVDAPMEEHEQVVEPSVNDVVVRAGSHPPAPPPNSGGGEDTAAAGFASSPIRRLRRRADARGMADPSGNATKAEDVLGE